MKIPEVEFLHFVGENAMFISAGFATVLMAISALVNPVFAQSHRVHKDPSSPVRPEETQLRDVRPGQRAVVDVDTELGLVRVVHIAVAQDAGRVVVADRAEARVASGAVAGAGFVLSDGDGLPYGWGSSTSMDQPEVVVSALLETAAAAKDELGSDGLPVAAPPLGGMKPVGDLSVMATPAAVLAAVRDAVGDPRPDQPLRLPLRPDRAWWVTG